MNDQHANSRTVFFSTKFTWKGKTHNSSRTTSTVCIGNYTKSYWGLQDSEEWWSVKHNSNSKYLSL